MIGSLNHDIYNLVQFSLSQVRGCDREKSQRNLVSCAFGKPLQNPGKVNNVIDITEFHCWILGNLCMQQQDIFVGNAITPKLSLLLPKFSSYSHIATTHSLLNDKLIGVSWTPPMWVQQAYYHITKKHSLI